MEPENQYLEQKLTPEEQMIEVLLAKAMEIERRPGLSARVAQGSFASIHTGSEQNLELQLDIAFAATQVEHLNTRVFNASASVLPRPLVDERAPVLARINITVLFRQVALAACLTFAAVVAIRFGSAPQQPSMVSRISSPVQPFVHARNDMSVDGNVLATSSAPAEVLSAEEEILLLQDLNLSEFTYLTDTREMAFADIAVDLKSLRDDIELWQFGLLTE